MKYKLDEMTKDHDVRMAGAEELGERCKEYIERCLKLEREMDLKDTQISVLTKLNDRLKLEMASMNQTLAKRQAQGDKTSVAAPSSGEPSASTLD